MKIFWMLYFPLILGVVTETISLKISTNSGKVKGVTETLPDGKKVNVWLGIPYAKKPIGDRRFRRPEPVLKWSGTKNATKHAKLCMEPIDSVMGGINQLPVRSSNVTMSEDCLYLSIYAPNSRSNRSVLVSFSGVGFVAGNIYEKHFDVKTLVAETGTVVVTVQFRLGSFGFLYSGTDEAPGNMGLFDQHLALKWVHENIEAFGGNRNSITIWGETSGATSAVLHLFYKPSWKFFSQVTVESRNMYEKSDISSKQEAESKVVNLAKALKCPYNASNLSVSFTCLKSKSAEDIVKAVAPTITDKPPFGPVLDGNFVPDSPGKLLLKGDYKKVNVLMGVNNDSSAFFLIKFINILAKFNAPLTHDALIKVFQLEDPKYTKTLGEIISFQYTDAPHQIDDVKRNRDALNQMANDRFYNCPMFNLASLFLKNTTTDLFIYIFDHRMTHNTHESWVGPTFCDNAVFLSGRPLHSSNFTKAEKKLSQMIMNFWANFAARGNPNIYENGKKTSVVWPKFAANDHKYLSLTTAPKVKTNMLTRQCFFWEKIFPQVERDCQK